jgi:hypothetical protein
MAETYTKEQLALLAEAQKMSRLIGIDMEKQADIQAEILSGIIQNKAQLREQLEIVRKHLKEEKDLLKTKQEQEKAAEDYAEVLQSSLTPLNKMKKISADTLQKDIQKIDKALELEQITKDQADRLKQQLETINKIASNPIAKVGFTSAVDTLDSMQSSINDFMKKLPGGEMLSKALGLDKLSEKIQNSILEGGKLGIVGVIAVAGILYAVLSSITKEAREFATATGVTYGQARQIADEARKASLSYNNQLATQKDILAVQQETIKAFGTTAMLTGEQAANVADLGKSFGYGAQQAASVNNAFMSMGATATTAYEAQQSLAAEALKAGVNVGAVTKDIAENSKQTAKYFGGNVQALKDSAIQAAKMGMTLDTMAKISDKLLDVQSSLTAQFEFQALSGRQIDLDLARQLALEGDIAGAAKEVLNAVGSTAEFNSMNMLQRKKLAEAVGMEVDELQRSLVIQEKLGDLTEDQKAAMSGLNLSAAELNDKTPEQLQALLAQQDALMKAESTFDNIKSQLLVALVPAAEMFASAIAGIMPIFKLMKPVLIVIGKLVESIVAPFKFLGMIIDYIQSGIDLMSQKFSFLEPVINGISTVFSFIFDVLSSIGGVLGGVLIPYLTLMAGKAVVGAYRMVAQAIAGIFTSFSSYPFGVGIPLAFGVVGGLTALISKFTTKTGDLAMPSGGGPIVTNPREGTIFQGTKNDEVAMGPGVIGMAQQSGTGTQTVVNNGSNTDMTETNNLLRQLLGKQSVAVINWGDRDTSTLGNKLKANDSFRTSYNGGYSS